MVSDLARCGIALLLLVACLALSAGAAEPLKPRVVVLTDVSTWETDSGAPNLTSYRRIILQPTE